jgi:mono/diheme cytochrome c family protein
MRTLILAVLLASACGTARRGEPLLAGPIQLSGNAFQGKLLFMKQCNQCHPNGEAATGPSINNKPIPRAVMTLQIRKGVLGTMPKFSEHDLSDQEVGAILDYIEAMRKHRP